MRTAISVAALTAVLAAASGASAQDKGFVQGFGALRVENQSRADTSVGGVIAGHLTPNIQLVGEAGRTSNVLPTFADSLLEFSPIGFDVSAWYAEGGLRLTTGNRSGVRPYLTTSAGMARLQPALHGLGSGLVDTISGVALQFLSETDPVASVGGGVTIGGGPVVADLGYRYRRIFSSGWVDALTLGDRLQTSEVRFGLGVRF